MRRTYGYGSYRGKSGFRTFLKIVAVALALVLALLVAAFFFLQRYIVYSADGVRLELPFFTRADEPPPPSQPIVVETPAPIIVTPEPTPTPAPHYARMITIPNDVLQGDAVKGLFDRYDEDPTVEADYPGFGQATQLIFNMKGADGMLGYISDVPLAREVRSSGADPVRQEGIESANQRLGGILYNAAYLSCFKDNTAPYNNNSLALRTAIGNWRAPGDQRWMSPQVAAARQYITDLCVELMGTLNFNDLILDAAAFPAEGDLSLIIQGDRYDPAALADTVTDFYAQVRSALGDYLGRQMGSEPYRLGIVTDKTTLQDGANPLTGQTLDALVKYADRIYADLGGEDPAAYWEALRARGVEKPEEFLIAVLKEPPAEDVSYSWAILPE